MRRWTHQDRTHKIQREFKGQVPLESGEWRYQSLSNMKGKFVTFEGSEGSGKSTQSAFLAEYLKVRGYDVLYIREPGGTPISEHIRSILLDQHNAAMGGFCELLLYMAARAQTVEEVILPALRAGRIVICDRFLDSTLAYQGYGLGIDLKAIKYIGRLATKGVKPDLTIFLDLAVRKGLRHRRVDRDRIENRPLSYHQRVRLGYLKLAKRQPGRIKVVELDDDLEKTQSRIRELIEQYVLSAYKRPG